MSHTSSRLPPAPPPSCPRHPRRSVVHGDERVDDYAWLRDPSYPEVTDPEILNYLKAENAYLEQALEPVQALRARLEAELRRRVQPNDDSVPARKQAFWYQTRYLADEEHPRIWRWGVSEAEAEARCLLDLNQLAEGSDYFDLGDFSTSPDQSRFAYSLDLDGSERHEVRFREVSGEELPDRIPGTQGEIVWSSDGQYVFYARLDEQQRPSQIYRHRLGTASDADVLVYEEADPGFWLSVDQTSDERFVVISSSDKQTSEVRLLDAAQPLSEPRLILPRRNGHEYDVDHRQGELFIRTNNTHRNFRLMRAGLSDTSEAAWTPWVEASDACYIEGFALFQGHLVALEREAGLPHVRIFDLAQGGEHRISFPDPAYTVSIGDNPEFEASSLRIEYQSLVSPPSVIDYDMRTRERRVRKVQKIPSGYDASEYASRRSLAVGADGAQIPVSVVYRRDQALGPETPLYLYVYGSYGITIDPYFSPNRLSLLDRGFAFAIAHVRGGSAMGRHWYEDGKLLKKQNTFNDIKAVVEQLEREGVSSRGHVTISGGSAGGMAVAAMINQVPSYFHAAVASVPFVDCLNTMLDSSLPLTPPEYTEWGNPELDAEVYRYMLSYSPYDNVRAQGYPHLLITAGISDPRVTYWEPAKWAAKLRALKTDKNLLVLHTNLSAGHGGASGRFEALKELALEYAFLLWVYDHPDAQLAGSAS